MAEDMWWVDNDENPRITEEGVVKTAAPLQLVAQNVAAKTQEIAQHQAVVANDIILQTIATALTEATEKHELLLQHVQALQAKISLQAHSIKRLDDMLNGLGKRLVKFIENCEVNS